MRGDLIWARVVLGSALALGAGCASNSTMSETADRIAAALPAVTDEVKGSNISPAEWTLSRVMREEQFGLAWEAEESRNRIKLQATDFILYKSGRLKISARHARVGACQLERDTNPFCSVILKDDDSRERIARSRRKPRPVRDIASARRALVRGDVAALTQMPEADVASALGGIRDVFALKVLLKNVQERDGCSSPALLSGLGMKAEERFPDEKYKAQALELYSKAVQCKDGAYSMRAAYRLGLLHIWSERWKEADQVLQKVADSPDITDFRSRALYWRFHAAVKLGDRASQDLLRQRIIREYPLSLHGLLVGGGSESLSEFSIVNARDPEVQFRSLRRPELNGPVRAAEALQSIRAEELSFEVIEPILDELKGTEEGFQLYVVNLLRGSGETLRKFQLLAGLFRENPSLISKPTLEMLYPLRRFELIRQFESEVDPYLVISLIRQESAFNERAKSTAGAMGLMQLMPRTASRLEAIRKSDLFNPRTNVRIGVKYFGRLLARYDGNAELALAAYNAGPERVDQWKRRYPYDNRLLFVDMIPFRETREYVASIARNYYWYLRLYAEDMLRTRIVAQGEGAVPGTRMPASEAARQSKLGFFSLFRPVKTL